MCSNCSITKLRALPQSEQTLIPNLFQFLLVSSYHLNVDKKESFIKLLNLLSIILKDTAVGSHLFISQDDESKYETPLLLAKEVQRRFFKGTSIATKEIEDFLYLIKDNNSLWSIPEWIVIHWISLRVSKERFTEFLLLISDTLPCPKCSGHTKLYINNNPVTDDIFEWSVKFHTASSPKERALSPDEIQIWKGYYSK